MNEIYWVWLSVVGFETFRASEVKPRERSPLYISATAWPSSADETRVDAAYNQDFLGKYERGWLFQDVQPTCSGYERGKRGKGRLTYT